MAKRGERGKAYFMISAVSQKYDIHPQTLRLYEREGLLKPSRTDGNTRLYSEEDLRQLEVILNLTRDLGVNLAGVEIILNMREKMDAMQREFERFFTYLQSHAEEFTHLTEPPPPEPSTSRMRGRRISLAMRSHIRCLPLMVASAEPPRTVKSSPPTTTGRPSTRARPNTKFEGVRFTRSLRSS